VRTLGPLASILTWVIIGIAAVAAMTAGIAVGTATLHTAGVVSELTSQLHASRVQQDRQGAQLEALKVQAANNAKDARVAVRQNRRLLAYLKGNGIKIPKSLTEVGRSPGGGSPKGQASTGTTPTPRPHSPATQGPTATPTPSPTPGVLDLLCNTIPNLCKH
jgi:hypothetical protein